MTNLGCSTESIHGSSTIEPSIENIPQTADEPNERSKPNIHQDRHELQPKNKLQSESEPSIVDQTSGVCKPSASPATSEVTKKEKKRQKNRKKKQKQKLKKQALKLQSISSNKEQHDAEETSKQQEKSYQAEALENQQATAANHKAAPINHLSVSQQPDELLNQAITIQNRKDGLKCEHYASENQSIKDSVFVCTSGEREVLTIDQDGSKDLIQLTDQVHQIVHETNEPSNASNPPLEPEPLVVNGAFSENESSRENKPCIMCQPPIEKEQSIMNDPPVGTESSFVTKELSENELQIMSEQQIANKLSGDQQLQIVNAQNVVNELSNGNEKSREDQLSIAIESSNANEPYGETQSSDEDECKQDVELRDKIDESVTLNMGQDGSQDLFQCTNTDPVVYQRYQVKDFSQQRGYQNPNQQSVYQSEQKQSNEQNGPKFIDCGRLYSLAERLKIFKPYPGPADGVPQDIPEWDNIPQVLELSVQPAGELGPPRVIFSGGTSLPKKQWADFSNPRANQINLGYNIHFGYQSSPMDNYKLGSVELAGSPFAARHQNKNTLIFELDKYGDLEVTVLSQYFDLKKPGVINSENTIHRHRFRDVLGQALDSNIDLVSSPAEDKKAVLENLKHGKILSDKLNFYENSLLHEALGHALDDRTKQELFKLIECTRQQASEYNGTSLIDYNQLLKDFQTNKINILKFFNQKNKCSGDVRDVNCMQRSAIA